MNTTTQQPLTIKRPRIFYGWYIVAASGIQAIYTSGTFFFGFTAFFNPIANEFGWSRAATAAALSLQRTEGAVAGPFVGMLVDKYGGRWLMMAGTLVTGLGFFLLARIHSLPAFYLAFGVIALGMSMGAMTTTTPVIANWFVRQRSRAMTIAFAGGASGGVVVPLLIWAVARYGWRDVLDWIGIGTIAVGVPVALMLRHRPESYGYLPDGGPARAKTNHSQARAKGQPVATQTVLQEQQFTMGQALKTPAFWLLTMGMGFSGLVMSVVIVFVVPVLESYGISSHTAGFAVLLISVFNVLGRLAVGFVGDVVDKRKLLVFTYLMLALGALSFAAIHEAWQIAFLVLTYSVGHGGTMPIRFALLADYFGRRSFGALVGLTGTLTAVFGVVGPVFTGWVFDMTGSYRLAFLVIGLTAMVSIPITLLVKRPRLPTGTA